MADWAMFDGLDGLRVWINRDNIACVRQHPDHTIVKFIGDKENFVAIKQLPAAVMAPKAPKA